MLRAQFVADGGKSAVIAVDDHETRAEREMLVWTADGQVRSSTVYEPGQDMIGGIWARNRNASLDRFVAVGKRRRDSFPYIWTAAGGIEMHPGGVELARALA